MLRSIAEHSFCKPAQILIDAPGYLLRQGIFVGRYLLQEGLNQCGAASGHYNPIIYKLRSEIFSSIWKPIADAKIL